jgi:DNA-binding transcriptional regulator YiaG
MDKKYQSELLMVCHQDAVADYEIGAITEAQMREYDEACLVPEATSTVGTTRQPSVPCLTHLRQA